jgi:hypothetical protein
MGVAVSQTVSEEVIFSPTLQKAYFEIQKLRISEATEIIKQEKIKNPGNPFIVYLENYADLYYLLVSEDKKAYKNWQGKEDQRLEILDKLHKNNPFKRFFQAEIRVHSAFVKIKFGSEISGAWDVIKAVKLLEENKKLFPEFKPTYKTLGLLHILIGSVPDQYAWVTKILGLRGNIQTGIKEIRMVSNGESIFSQEAKLIDILIHAYTLELSEDQLQQLLKMAQTQPDNLLLHFFAATTLMKESKGEEALHFLNRAVRSKNHLKFPLIEYIKAELYLQKGQYRDAELNYSLFLKSQNGVNYIKDAYFKRFLCDWLENPNEANKTFLDSVLKHGSNVLEADKMAARLAKEFKTGKLSNENRILFKARYASDGGFLKLANIALSDYNESSFTSTENKAEFNYRKGRIAQKSHNFSSAINHYQRTLSIIGDQYAGLGAAAALQLGYIYQAQNSNTQALHYFRLATTFKNHDYKSSIDNKAQAAITGLTNK